MTNLQHLTIQPFAYVTLNHGMLGCLQVGQWAGMGDVRLVNCKNVKKGNVKKQLSRTGVLRRQNTHTLAIPRRNRSRGNTGSNGWGLAADLWCLCLWGPRWRQSTAHWPHGFKQWFFDKNWQEQKKTNLEMWCDCQWRYQRWTAEIETKCLPNNGLEMMQDH